MLFFTKSAHWAHSVIESRCPSAVCLLFVVWCPEDFWLKGLSIISACKEKNYIFFISFYFIDLKKKLILVFGASILWILGEVAGKGFVAVAVGFSDM